MLNISNDLQNFSIQATDLVDYQIEVTDGVIGYLQAMLIDTESWTIRYLIVNTGTWWLGHAVLIAPQWIREVSWLKSKIYVDMTQEQVKKAPVFNPIMPFDRELEKGIYRHYGREGYWEENAALVDSA